VRNYDLFILLSVRAQNRINLSQKIDIIWKLYAYCSSGSVPWLHCQKYCWPRVLGSVVIQLYAGECTPSV